MTRLVPVHEPAGNRNLNVVFVHGLGGDAWKTWAHNGEQDNYWPRRLADVVQAIGVYSLDYDATPSTWLGKAALSIPDRALSVLSYLVSAPALRTAPIVFICHSLGGLVVKELLLDANEQGKREKSFLENVRGIAFLATPHSGSDLATLLQALQFVSRATPVAMDLAHNNPHLLKQRQRYQTWSHQNRVRHLVFREAEKTKNLTMVVPPDSADPVFPNAWAIPVEKDHFEICKPEDESSEVHVRVVDFLLELIHAPERNTSEEAVVLSRIEQAVALAREEGIDLKILTPIFENLGHQNLTPEEMKARAKDAVARIVERAVQTVSPSNEGADIDATIAAARAQLKTANTVAARALLDAKIAEEEAARHQRLLPLLRERYGIERLTFDYSAAKTTLTELSRLEPEKSWILIELGDIERIIGTLDAAERAFTNALTRAKSKSDRRHQSVALDRIGDVLVARNDLEGALKHYREGLEIARVLYDQDKSRAGRARDVSVSLDRIGDVLMARNDLEEALKHYREGLEIARVLYDQDKSHAERALEVSVSVSKIGDVLMARTDLEGALKHYREGLDIRRVLHDQDKSNAERARDVALSLLQVGLVAKQQKDLSHACASFREGKSIIKRLMTAAPDVYELANDFALFEKRMKEADCPPEQ